MDDILQRILAIEKEAAQIVLKAGQNAESILNDARAESEVLKAELEKETTDLVRALISEKVAEAESTKEAALKDAEAVLIQRQEEFKLHIAQRRDFIKNCLADPEYRRS